VRGGAAGGRRCVVVAEIGCVFEHMQLGVLPAGCRRPRCLVAQYFSAMMLLCLSAWWHSTSVP